MLRPHYAVVSATLGHWPAFHRFQSFVFSLVTRATLLQVLARPTALGPAEVRELEQLAQAFPYCQTAHLLLAKAAHDHGTMLAGQRLRRAATYAADRALLRRLIEEVEPAAPAVEPAAAESTLPPAPEPLPPTPAEPSTSAEAPLPVAAPAIAAATEVPAAAPIATATEPAPEVVVSTPILEPSPELVATIVPSAPALLATPVATPEAVLEVAAPEPEAPTVAPVAEALPAPTAEVAPEPEIAPAPAHEIALEPETAPVLEPEIAPEPETALVPKPAPEPETVPEPGPEPEPEVAPVTEEPVATEAVAAATKADDLPVLVDQEGTDILTASPLPEPLLEAAPEEEPDLPAQAPAIRPPAEAGEARFEFGLSEPPPAPPTYELPGLVDEWAASAVTRRMGSPEPVAGSLPLENEAPALTPAAFTGDEAIGYSFGESSRLGLSMQLLNLLTDEAEKAAAEAAAAQPPAVALPPAGAFFEPDPLLLDHWATHRPPAPVLPSSFDLINNFLKRQPRLTRPAMLPPAPGGQTDLSVRSTRAEPDLVSENLARIYVRQGKTARAIEIYEKLMVKQPEKMAYFAAQIQSLQPSA